MPTIIISTVGGATSNSYTTDAEAATYWSTRLGGDTWAAETDTATREKALITATSKLDENIFIGSRVSGSQRLKFPRYWVERIDLGASGNVSYYYTNDEIPQQIKDATIELAQELLGSASAIPAGLEMFKVLRVGPLDMELNVAATSQSLSSRVSVLLRGFLQYPSGVQILRA